QLWLLIQSLALLPLTDLAVSLVGLRRWQSALTRLAPMGPRPKGDAASQISEGRAIARLVDAAARHGPYRATCLPRALVLWWLLRRRGIMSDLRIGVHKEAGQLTAHAWIELAGAPLNDG